MGSSCSLCDSCVEYSPNTSMFKDEIFFIHQLKPNRQQIIQKHIQSIQKNYTKENFYKNIQWLFSKVKTNREKEIIQKIEYHNWNDQITEANKRKKNFSLITILSNSILCDLLFPKISDSLKKEPIPQQNDLKSVILMIQAIHIELFLLTRCKPNLNNFKGKVFRGIKCSKFDYHLFSKSLSKNFQKRIISAPLSISLASYEWDLAEKFTDDEQNVQILFAVHIVSLRQDDLTFFRKKFSKCIVSTTCAVDITQLCSVKTENCILLTEASYLILKIQEMKYLPRSSQKAINYVKIDCVLVNAELNHINNLHRKDISEAKQLFELMIEKARGEFAIDFLNKDNDIEKITSFSTLVQDADTKIERSKMQLEKYFGQESKINQTS